MITIDSARYGKLTVNEDQVYEFPQGIVGFSGITRFALIPFENTEFFVLHSDATDVSFILLPAAKAIREYAFELGQETVEMLEASNPDDVVPFLILNFIDNVPYVNLKAPILIVPSSQKGCQYVISSPPYPIRERLVYEEQESC